MMSLYVPSPLHCPSFNQSPLFGEHLDGGRISFCALCSKDQVDLSPQPLDPDKNRYGTRERRKKGDKYQTDHHTLFQGPGPLNQALVSKGGGRPNPERCVRPQND